MRIEFKCPGCGAVIEAEGRAGGSDVLCPGCGARLAVPPASAGPGVTIGGFRIERLVGRGGMGEVYLARQLSLDRDVALKILPARFAGQREDVERFLREMRLLARLDHPHIVTAYEAGEDAGVLFLAMAYVKGESLSERLRREHRLAMPEALRLIRPLAEALAYAWHEHGLLHRDVKPGNILIDSHGDPKLLDFGLAKGLGTDTQLTINTVMMGSPNYMSPEQAAGDSALDFRTDIYGLGATLYHLLTGKAPFDASSVMETLRKSVSEKLPDPREVNGTVTGCCVALLSRMLALAPEQRHASWAALIEDITRVSKGLLPHLPALPESASALSRGSHATGPAPAGPGPAAAAPPAARRRGMSAGAWAATGVALFAGIALLSLGLAVRSSQRHQAQPPPPVALRVASPKRLTPVAPGAGPPPSAGALGGLAARAVRSSVPSTVPPADPPSSEPPPAAPPAAALSAPAPQPQVKPAPPVTTAEDPSHAQAREALARHAEALADALLDRNGNRLRERLSAGAGDAALVPAQEQWRALSACAEQAAAIAETLGASFRRDAGREVPVELTAGTRSLLIAGVQGDTVLARQVVREGNRVKAEIPRDFSLADLTPRARLERLGADDDAVTQLRRGLLAWECRATDAARRGFEQSACLLGTSLVSRLDARLRQQAEAADAQAQAAAERAAVLDFAQLMKLACPAYAGDDGAAVASAVQTVRRTRFSEKKAVEIVKGAGEFRARHGATACAQGKAAVLETLAAVRPDFPLEVDAAAISTAEAAFRKANPRATVDWFCSSSQTGLDLDLFRSGGLIDDLGPLAGLPIQSLRLKDSTFNSLAALRGMPLRSLRLEGQCRVTALDPLAGMPLETLQINAGSLSTLLPLRSLPLRKLDIKYCNGIDSLAPLRGMSLTNVLIAYNTRITDLSPLKGLPLIELTLMGVTSLKEISPLKGMSLASLTLSGCPIQDISALAGMPLTRLNLCNTRVADLTPLKGMPLMNLLLGNSLVADISALEGLPITWLDLSATRVRDISPLRAMPLNAISLNKTPVTDLSPLAGKTINIIMPDGSQIRGTALK